MDQEEKVLSSDDLKRQAMAMFATLQSKRGALPARLTDELNKEAQRYTNAAAHAIRCNRVFNTWVMDTLRHNKRRIDGSVDNTSPDPLAIIVFLLLDQCKNLATLKALETLGSQMMWVPQSGLGKIHLQEQQPRILQHPEVGRIYVRVEIFLTQAEDTQRFDMCVLDPETQIPATERDVVTIQRRIHALTGVPMEALQTLTDAIRRNPEAVLDELALHGDMRRAISMDADAMRVCSGCKKYGYNLGKCSGCKQAHYCGQECQKADWKTHKVKCGK